MKIGIIGGGVVGRATARAWLEHCDEVRVYDMLSERRTHTFYEVITCDVVFICLPETELDNLVCVHDHWRVAQALILKSTVPIGTTRHLADKWHLPNLVHCPEFLTARCSLTDAQIPSRIVIGGPMRDARAKVAEMHRNRFPGVPLLLMSSDESESVKLICNGFFAVKVAYFNEVRRMTDALGLEWDKVLPAVLADGRIAHAHTSVPGPDGKRGFGGTCLPKDLKMLIGAIHDAGELADMSLAALTRNNRDRQPEGAASCVT